MTRAEATLTRVLDAVSAVYPGVTRHRLLAPTRSRDPVPEARMLAMYAHNVVAKCTKTATAQLFMRRPGTMTHAVATVERLRLEDPDFAARLDTVLATLARPTADSAV